MCSGADLFPRPDAAILRSACLPPTHQLLHGPRGVVVDPLVWEGGWRGWVGAGEVEVGGEEEGLGWGRAGHTTRTVALGCADYVQHVFGCPIAVPGCPATYNRSRLSRHNAIVP